jgi:hypothetical protein
MVESQLAFGEKLLRQVVAGILHHTGSGARAVPRIAKPQRDSKVTSVENWFLGFVCSGLLEGKSEDHRYRAVRLPSLSQFLAPR